jgi:ferrous iron transport protein B
MSCSARLPVYILIISAFFTKYQGLILVSIYLTGIILGGVVALLMNKTVFRKQDVPFVMELPPYRLPTLRNSTIHMWYKGSQYLRKMGTTILVASVVIWVLSYYPREVSYSADYESQIASIINDASVATSEKESIIGNLELMKMTEKQEQSYIGRLGHFIEPALRPIGFDWKIGVSILTGLAAKEIVISTMGILYQADAKADEKSVKLITRLQQQEHRSGKLAGQKVFTKTVALAFMMFILIYFPCVAVVTAIRKESELKWAVFTVVYSTTLAWVVAFLVYNAGNFLTGLQAITPS